MHLVKSATALLVACTLVTTLAQAQQIEAASAIVSRDVASQVAAFNYREGPESHLLLTGTPMTPLAAGDAEVEFQKGRSAIEVSVRKLPPVATLGSYTTYLLWAVRVDGRAENLGAIVPDSRGSGKLKTSFAGSEFALIVTAEPHFAVSAPSTAIVLFNVAKNVKGTETRITTLAERADYSNLAKIAIDARKAPASLVGARYAVAIAAAAGAEKYAAAAFAEARDKLAEAETAQASKKSSERKKVPLLARAATQAGEGARRAGMAGTAAADAEAKRAAAVADAEAAAKQRADAESARAAERAAVAAAAERESAVERARQQARAEIRARLNSALPTRETERGLVSEIGGVQFATGTATLGAPGRESLATFAGVVASYPGLRIKVEGHTDNVGSEAINRELSLKRAIAVRDFLIGKGIAASSIDVDGLGASMPIGDNATADGRARNRRVELVISGGPLEK